jgi:hypothetical protein
MPYWTNQAHLIIEESLTDQYFDSDLVSKSEL